MKKRIIIIAALIISFCIVGVIILTNYENSKKRIIINAEITKNLENIAKDKKYINLKEVTSFEWDKAYSYGGYSTIEEYQLLMENVKKRPKYIETYELDHRILFYNNNKLVFDTYIINEWYMLPNDDDKRQVILTNEDVLEIMIGTIEGKVFLYYEIK